MSESIANQIASVSVSEALRLAGSMGSRAKLTGLRFLNGKFELPISPSNQPEASLKVDVTVSQDKPKLYVSVDYQLLLTSTPGNASLPPLVELSALIVLVYELNADLDLDSPIVQAFGRINGVYNSWPFWREFIQTSMIKMALPPFLIPLLMAPSAAKFAGYADIDLSTAAKNASDSASGVA